MSTPFPSLSKSTVSDTTTFMRKKGKINENEGSKEESCISTQPTTEWEDIVQESPKVQRHQLDGATKHQKSYREAMVGREGVGVMEGEIEKYDSRMLRKGACS